MTTCGFFFVVPFFWNNHYLIIIISEGRRQRKRQQSWVLGGFKPVTVQSSLVIVQTQGKPEVISS